MAKNNGKKERSNREVFEIAVRVGENAVNEIFSMAKEHPQTHAQRIYDGICIGLVTLLHDVDGDVDKWLEKHKPEVSAIVQSTMALFGESHGVALLMGAIVAAVATLKEQALEGEKA